MKTRTIIVLSDEETWNEIDGCSICIVTEEQFNELADDRIDVRDLTPLAEIGLKHYGS